MITLGFKLIGWILIYKSKLIDHAPGILVKLDEEQARTSEYLFHLHHVEQTPEVSVTTSACC
jgi:hypothetical protein